jgi:hypothetical protein
VSWLSMRSAKVRRQWPNTPALSNFINIKKALLRAPSNFEEWFGCWHSYVKFRVYVFAYIAICNGGHL